MTNMYILFALLLVIPVVIPAMFVIRAELKARRARADWSRYASAALVVAISRGASPKEAAAFAAATADELMQRGKKAPRLNITDARSAIAMLEERRNVFGQVPSEGGKGGDPR
jgi:hypothetical protein